jgi:transketolase N-terminal domain/subunit
MWTPEHFTSPDRDRYIQSKGHTVEALYVVLASRGFFPESDLETLCKYQSHYIGHPTRKVHGIEQNTGALGHGLSLSVGTAIAGKMDKKDYKVFTVLGDGELPEGSNWEPRFPRPITSWITFVRSLIKMSYRSPGQLLMYATRIRSTRNLKHLAGKYGMWTATI